MVIKRVLVVHRRVLEVAFLGVLPSLLLADFLWAVLHLHAAHDFHTFWQAARTYAAGDNPYPHVSVLRWSPQSQESFVYPPPVAALLTPFGVLPFSVAAGLFTIVLVASLIVALRLFGVRDWRCYGAVFLWPATLAGVGLGSLSPLLLLGVAACWRWRDRAAVAGLVLALVVLSKLFLWPLAVWCWFTGRRRQALIACGVAIAASVASWSWIGFRGLTQYPALLHRISALDGPRGYAPGWRTAGEAGVAILACILLPALALACRRLPESKSFATAVIVALLITPILWVHYLVLLAVIAADRPRLNRLWLVPLLFLFTPATPSLGHPWRTVLVAAVLVYMGDRVVRGGRSSADETPRSATIAVAA